MHDPTLYSTDGGKLALPLRACAIRRQSAERFASRKHNISLPMRTISDRGGCQAKRPAQPTST
ncbi:hypothetical protein P8H27_05225 [Pseudomonas sp. sp1636]|uniref:hypothetical protein n=1 Tax=Pseudomonas sp. sp1636 TaxID=3036707 RepID=UPI0025A50642|nr:hypothetical protein [Pseudomonas sp. sp1636]MDM8348294.1 hypothetical protein [Pseudomonas sp. sp1636]